MAWTNEQQSAIDARNCDMLVAAAAGSGKTAVLVERIIKLVSEGADIERMLIVTFTNAVASEMRERLAAKFEELSADEHMRAQAQACRQAHIQTLHSFCRDVCRAYFLAADVDPGFRILDEQESQLIRERALDSALLDEFETMDDNLHALNALRGPDELRGMVIALSEFLGSRSDGDEWVSGLCSKDTRLKQMEELNKYVRDLLATARRALLGANRLASTDPDAGIYCKSLERDLLEWPNGDDLQYLIHFNPGRFDAEKGKKAPKGASSAPCSVMVKAIRKNAKNLTSTAQKAALLLAGDGSEDYAYLDLAIPALMRLQKAFEKEYSQRKKERCGMDFNDLEHKALRALNYPYVEQSVRAQFDYVFVDEYQDISLVQDSIIGKIAAPRTLFMVGDIKQSIYRFRQADPLIFLDKYARFDALPGGDTLRIDLNRNFRSRANVLNFVNGIFGRVMNSAQYEIDYDENAALKPGLPVQEDDPVVEIHLLGDDARAVSEDELEITDEPEDELEELSREESEAHVAAEVIKSLIGTPMLDQKAGTLRSIAPRDIVLLSRKVKSIAPKALEVLLGEGIPAYADASGGYFDTLEVRQMLQLMRVIDNRMRDYELLGVLHSPMFLFSANDLGAIRAYTPRGSFADALEAYALGHDEFERLQFSDASAAADDSEEDCEDDLTEDADIALPIREDERDAELLDRVQNFLQKLDAWQRNSRYMTLTDLIWMLMDETGYYVYAGALPGGIERQANLRLLCERAAAYEDAQYGGLHGFLKYIEQLKTSGQDMTTASTLGEGDDVVRIMSVHKSKGLEFPVVIGLNLGVSFQRPRTQDLMLSGELGMGMFRMDEEQSARRNTAARMAISVRKTQEELAEEMRILYVLLTRARDRLVLIGSVKDIWASEQLWECGAIGSPHSALDWIMPAAFKMQLSGEAKLVTLHHPARWQAAASVMPELDEKLAELRRAPADDDMLNRLTWRYPYEDAVLAPLKLTASQLGRELEGPAAMPECRERPQFLSETEMNALEKGVATHAVMQWLDLKRLRELDGAGLTAEISAQLDELQMRGTLTIAQRGGVRQNAIVNFFLSDIGQRMLKSPRVEREWPFNLRMTVGEALASGEKPGASCDGERILVQGIIDCCFEEDGKWVLVDYKTDRGDDPAQLRDRYITQLSLYARALNEITDMRVKQMGLFMLRQGKFLDLT